MNADRTAALMVGGGVYADRVVGRLRAAREDFSMSQRALAERLSVSATSVANWERCRAYPTAPKLVLWSAEFGFRMSVEASENAPSLGPLRLDDGESLVQAELRRLATVLWGRRRGLGLSQTQLSGMVGVGRISLQRWESVKPFPRVPWLVAWCEALDCELGVRDAGLRRT